jgi:hypothetical protein
VSGRQLCWARALAGLTQIELAREAGFNPDACRYWEKHLDDIPTTVQRTLDKITEALARHGVMLFTEPTPGVRMTPQRAAAR